MKRPDLPWTYIKELWGTPDGQIYYQLNNWFGFYECVPNVKQHPGGKVETIPDGAFLLMKDGEWTGAATFVEAVR